MEENKQDNDMELFQEEFKRYQKLFGLTGYKVYFKYELLEDGFADISINQGLMVVAVRLNSKLPDTDIPFKDVKRSAKHEAIHLLLGRLEENARWRYASEHEIYESTEELVFKLEDLLP